MGNKVTGVVSRYREPQLQVDHKYLYLYNLNQHMPILQIYYIICFEEQTGRLQTAIEMKWIGL